MVELGKSLNKLLNGLEDLGIEAAIPQDMEMDLRHAMDLIDIGDAASSLTATNSRPNVSHPWPLINPISLGSKQKNIFLEKNKDDIDAGNEADDDMTEEFLSKNSPYRSFLDEGCEKQVAQFFQGGLFKSGSKLALSANTDDGEDTDADVDDVIDEEEINNFVDFLQFATSADFHDDTDGSNNASKELLQFAAFASAASNVLSESPLIAEVQTGSKNDYMVERYVKDDAFSMLPAKLSLQHPEIDNVGYLQNEKVSDIERLFLNTSNFGCKMSDKTRSHNIATQSSLRTSCSKQ
jgi:hypothetical protein